MRNKDSRPLLSRRALWLALAICCAPAVAQEEGRKEPQIDFVNMGGNDCPPCVLWRATELPRLQALPEFKWIRYNHVVKTIQSPVPAAFFFPSEIKHLQPALKQSSNGWSGSPQQAIVVDGKVIDYWWGTGRGSAEELAAMFRAIRAGQPLPRKVCAQLDTRTTCKTS